MTVNELIKKLQKCSPDAEIYVAYHLRFPQCASVENVIEHEDKVYIGENCAEGSTDLPFELSEKLFREPPLEMYTLITEINMGPCPIVRRKLNLKTPEEMIDFLKWIDCYSEK